MVSFMFVIFGFLNVIFFSFKFGHCKLTTLLVTQVSNLFVHKCYKNLPKNHEQRAKKFSHHDVYTNTCILTAGWILPTVNIWTKMLNENENYKISRRLNIRVTFVVFFWLFWCVFDKFLNLALIDCGYTGIHSTCYFSSVQIICSFFFAFYTRLIDIILWE